MERKIIDVYCDESCHLEKDQSRFMIIGAVYCRNINKDKLVLKIKDAKINNGFTPEYEIKWTKIRKANLKLALDLINLFFDNNEFRFRAYIIDKKNLNHALFNQDHDTWYYKMFYKMLEFIIDQDYRMNIYLDIKDTRSGDKISELKRILNVHASTFGHIGVNKIQAIRSYESQIIQLTDLIIGALRYNSTKTNTSESKMMVVDQIKKRYGKSLDKNTSYEKKKFNLFHCPLNGNGSRGW